MYITVYKHKRIHYKYYMYVYIIQIQYLQSFRFTQLEIHFYHLKSIKILIYIVYICSKNDQNENIHI